MYQLLSFIVGLNHPLVNSKIITGKQIYILRNIQIFFVFTALPTCTPKQIIFSGYICPHPYRNQLVINPFQPNVQFPYSGLKWVKHFSSLTFSFFNLNLHYLQFTYQSIQIHLSGGIYSKEIQILITSLKNSTEIGTPSMQVKIQYTLIQKTYKNRSFDSRLFLIHLEQNLKVLQYLISIS